MSSQSSTPARSQRSQKSKTKSPRPKSPLFTPRMQDAQARNKDPYGSDSSDDEMDGSGSGGKRTDLFGNDSYEQIQRRREAAIVLDSPELLMMHAQARNDSITGTRYYFTKMLCGYLDENDTYEVIKESPKEPEKGKERKTGKGKARESAAGGS